MIKTLDAIERGEVSAPGFLPSHYAERRKAQTEKERRTADKASQGGQAAPAKPVKVQEKDAVELLDDKSTTRPCVGEQGVAQA